MVKGPAGISIMISMTGGAVGPTVSSGAGLGAGVGVGLGVGVGGAGTGVGVGTTLTGAGIGVGMAVGGGVPAAGPQPLTRIKRMGNAIQNVFLISNHLLITVKCGDFNPPLI